MKLLSTLTTAALISTLSFSAFAAQEISREKAKEMKLEMIGTVDTNSTLSPIDAKKHLSDKADAKGGKYYVIIAAAGKGHIHATAEVFK
ncbi:hypothetical protein BL250_05860 [Erwinia sp. OLTSP20]|uniref:YdgH/BhsA/McbA-like domain containing protein n=1 Tax=unclassified Erwinia TaxID=2622719 RepID=UPI000C1930A3|nr:MULTISPECIES: YdgH/BhsA/McbA-like domain containing protein [unclassified Erwinia]PIJ51243.1 hypothetical protein BV501_05320 [Erwinia sp. OAMSP11]PIJ73994.1 hypothetical protein BK416_05595 [Erwinia sp. OLSSP12]PIJ84001.1 hypothetical protein BLD47_03220 [Erwinia sp. OLCASP19]PIJ86532.1 hypothetical protein BLD46_03500 [Erwinia sp. OLMTSP26]PIJ88011.1 hypothetical protein BLD49_04180 [Erwinia sp. OLMDSP33]